MAADEHDDQPLTGGITRPRSSGVGSRRGDVAFATSLDDLGGDVRFRRRDLWWRRERDAFARALA